MSWLMGMALILPLLAAWRNTFTPAYNRIRVPLAAREGRAPFVPLRILHLSDLHMENLSVPAEQVIEQVQGEGVDLIAITGDLLDRARNIPKAIAYVRTLHEQIGPTIGTYVVLGNHDYVLAPDKRARLIAGLEEIGCRVLRNESQTVEWCGVPLAIIGIDDYATRRSRLADAFSGVPEDAVRLVLTHDPNVVLEMDDYPYDYLLAGHFHGGQIHWPKPYHLVKMGRLPRMNIVKGLHHRKGRPFYISEGLGQTGLNIRVRSRPEVTLHTLGASGPSVAFAAASVPRGREAAVTNEVPVQQRVAID